MGEEAKIKGSEGLCSIPQSQYLAKLLFECNPNKIVILSCCFFTKWLKLVQILIQTLTWCISFILLEKKKQNLVWTIVIINNHLFCSQSYSLSRAQQEMACLCSMWCSPQQLDWGWENPLSYWPMHVAGSLHWLTAQSSAKALGRRPQFLFMWELLHRLLGFSHSMVSGLWKLAFQENKAEVHSIFPKFHSVISTTSLFSQGSHEGPPGFKGRRHT